LGRDGITIETGTSYALFHKIYGRERFFMDWRTVIFVTDDRQAGIGEFLPGTAETAQWTDEASENRCIEALRQADCVVLPTPIAKLTKYEDITAILKASLTSCKLLFGGKVEEGWKEWCSSKGILCCDFMEDDDVAQKNAIVTAEATVAEILKHSRYSIRGQKMIVTGYGRCGKATADLLRAMGAKVTVLARSREARIAARKEGHDAVGFSYGPEEMYGAYSIINTVPARVLTETMIAEMHPDTVIYDIASLPGGTDLDAAKKYHIPVISALGLPGRYTTKSSAKILAEAIQRQTLREQGVREGKSWIFQIII
jgi:dipicolinate synthase subunit A